MPRWSLPLLLLLPACAGESPVRLVLLLTVDQGRGDYLERFRPALEGGLATLYERGVVFTDAHHRHSTTVTAPGHASLSTGRFPSHSGVVGNNWYDRTEGRRVYCVEDNDAPILAPAATRRDWRSSGGRSPGRLLGNGLGDWVKASVPQARVHSVGAKDRAAILMGGRKADGVYWYDMSSGQWVTSRYYAGEYPEWVRVFHRRFPADDLFVTTWDPLPVEASELSRMEIRQPAEAFPKRLGGTASAPNEDFYASLFNSPYVESYLLGFAEALVVAEELGEDDAADVLALSFSSVDAVGHEYGPNSRELLDTVMRLDHALGRFFRFLDERIGLERIAIALSADHGVAPLPADPMWRVSDEVAACFQGAERALERRFGKADWFVEPLHFDYETLASREISRTELEDFLARELAECRGIRKAWTREEIERASASEGDDPERELYVNGFHPDRSPDLAVQLEEFHVARRRGTTHGSPYRYDTHVMAVVLWPGVAPRRIHEPIATVDLPVSLARLLGVEVPEAVDGVERTALMGDRRSLSSR